jgi:hypothetical protein
MPRRERRTTKRKKEMHPELKESEIIRHSDDDSVFCWELLD